jgi:hypothetical protein
MNYRTLLAALLIACTLPLAAEEAHKDEAPIKRAETPSAEGLELFSWYVKNSDVPRFALLPAQKTELLKSAADVTAGDNVLTGIEALKRKLSTLAIGEKVGWYNMLAKGKPIPEDITFDFPSREAVRDLELYCSALKVRLNIYRAGRK